MRYRYPCPPELSTFAGKLRAFLDALGVNSNPQILWNAIPFTFLVDWVVNVSGFLRQFRVPNVTFQIEILDFCHSAKLEKQVFYEIQHTSYVSGVGGGYRPSGFIAYDCASVKEYERKVGGFPGFLTQLQVSGLNAREILLGGSLIAANSSGRKTRR
jgi:hypothetical protein